MDPRFTQALNQPGYLVDIGWPIAGVEANSDALKFAVLAFANMFDQRMEKPGGNIVHAIEAEIFERVQCDALARARKAANDNETHCPEGLFSHTEACRPLAHGGQSAFPCAS